MKTMLSALLLTLLMTLSGCDDRASSPGSTMTQDEDVPEGGPEETGSETPYERAAPEWEERERGEVADGDQ